MIASRLADLRTVLLYPADFRIAAPKWPALLKSLDRLAGLLQSPSSEPDPDPRKSVHLAVDIGTCLWRIQQRSDERPETWNRHGTSSDKVVLR
jgi:hypothetical protein